MTQKQEHILCSAIHYNDGRKHVHQPVNIKVGMVVCGLRHHNCFYTLYEMSKRRFLFWTWHDLSYKKNCVQGFLTSNNRFVDRKDASTIAYMAGQIKERLAKLHSEDLWR